MFAGSSVTSRWSCHHVSYATFQVQAGTRTSNEQCRIISLLVLCGLYSSLLYYTYDNLGHANSENHSKSKYEILMCSGCVWPPSKNEK